MVSFRALWDNHPGRNSSPCEFTNQCAIRMGVSLGDSGVDTTTFRGARCWHGHSPAHILRAQELANWINENPILFGNRQIFKKNSSQEYMGKKGIIFIQNGWGPTDHIDIWNGSLMKGGSTDYLTRGDIWFWELN